MKDISKFLLGLPNIVIQILQKWFVLKLHVFP